MKPKYYLIATLIFLLILSFEFIYFKHALDGEREKNAEQDLTLQAHDKQIPYITKYIKLVKELSEVAKEN